MLKVIGATRLFLLTVLFIILLSLPAQAAIPTVDVKFANVHGIVATTSGRPVASAEVRLIDPETDEAAFTATTGADGSYRMIVSLLSPSKTFDVHASRSDLGESDIYSPDQVVVYPNADLTQNIEILPACSYIYLSASRPAVKADLSDQTTLTIVLTDALGDPITDNCCVFVDRKSPDLGGYLISTGGNELHDGWIFTLMGSTPCPAINFGRVPPSTGLDSQTITVAANYTNSRQERCMEKSIVINIIKDEPTAAPSQTSPTPGPASVTPVVTPVPPVVTPVPPVVTAQPTISASPASSPEAGNVTQAPTTQLSASVGPSAGPSAQPTAVPPDNLVLMLGGAVMVLLVAVALMGGYIIGKKK